MMKLCRIFKLLIINFSLLITSCAAQQQIGKTIDAVVNSKVLAGAHTGICIYEPATKQYWVNQQSDKYFVPASNTKLFSLYAGMKYLGDSLPGMQYWENDTAVYLQPTGDPTFLHADFKRQPVAEWLKTIAKPIYINDANWREKPWGIGWSWDDYGETYFQERSVLPVFGNTIHSKYPFVAMSMDSVLKLIGDSLHQELIYNKTAFNRIPSTKYSQLADSMYRLMMHRSDNFLAEQTLLMVSNQVLGFMNDALLIDSLLKSSLKELPQKPVWVDGSGLSRHNLFTPMDFVWVLNKMREEFGMKRLQMILPTAGEGTLKNYDRIFKGNLYAKTGSLTGQVSLSGFFTTKKGKQLIFSILINNHTNNPSEVRKAIIDMLMDIYKKY